jgi:altronate hydrolase
MKSKESLPFEQVESWCKMWWFGWFSGISANPAIGHTADLLVALGANVMIAEFPELWS